MAVKQNPMSGIAASFRRGDEDPEIITMRNINRKVLLHGPKSVIELNKATHMLQKQQYSKTYAALKSAPRVSGDGTGITLRCVSGVV